MTYSKLFFESTLLASLINKRGFNMKKKGFLSKEIYKLILQYIANKTMIARAEFCRAFPVFNLRTLIDEAQRGCGIEPCASTGKRVFHTPEAILEYINRNYKILSKEDIASGDYEPVPEI